MNRRQFLAGATTLVAGAKTQRPNIVLMVADDLGWRDFGCYGNTDYETPAIDAVAREGMRFTNSYAACPVCSPTRASILTGQYPARLQLTDWIPGRKQWPQARVLTPQFAQQLPLETVTIAEALKPLGYRTGSIGKWHLGGKGFGPLEQGFDVNVGGDGRGGVPKFFGPFDLPGLEGTTAKDYMSEVLTDAAERFVDDAVGHQQPFFLYMPHYAVHLPLSVREEWAAKYRKKFGSEKAFPVAEYAALMESFDQSVGRMWRKVAGLENTIFMVTSDNGGLRYEGASKRLVTDNSPLRAGKGHCYEGGIRTPLIVSWPGRVKAGTTTDAVVSTVDYLPTLVEAAGGRAPKVDGVSLIDTLRGKGAPRREAIYWHYPHYSNQGGVPSGAVRSGNYKLIEFYEDRRLELYDLGKDPGERRNLAKVEVKKARELAGKLETWRRSVKASMPTMNPGYDPARADQGLTGVEPPTQ